MANGNFAKFEKEEGELSPNVYFDEADLAAYGDHNRSNAKAKHSMAIDADVNDEDSKNVPEGGNDVSGGESNVDECSREDHKDGDRDDLDDHILLSAKPLEKRVASPLHDGGKKITTFSMEMNHFTCFFGSTKSKPGSRVKKISGPPYHDFSLMDILSRKLTRLHFGSVAHMVERSYCMREARVPTSSSEGSSSPVRSTTPDYLFDESIHDHWEVNQSLRILTSQMLVRSSLEITIEDIQVRHQKYSEQDPRTQGKTIILDSYRTSRDRHGTNRMSDPIGGLDTRV
nr:hypothetical protein [Tanacetum cinerariifolium]